MKLSIEYTQKKGYTVQSGGLKATGKDAREAVENLVQKFREEIERCIGVDNR